MATSAKLSSNTPDEIFLDSDGVSLCLLVNRRARTIRVIDFRSGPNPAKRVLVMGLAVREGLERVFTVVEKDEVGAWSRLGFAREGTIPGFYKRSDGWVLGASAPTPADDPGQSGLRPALAAGRDEEAHHERLYQAARKLAKARAAEALPPVKVQPAREADFARALATASRQHRALTSFEPFGRGTERVDVACTARGGFSLMASVETQACFDNAFIELLASPRSAKESALTAAAISRIAQLLVERAVVSAFALTPVEDVELGSAYALNGFRRTGVLAKHLRVGGVRRDAFLWSRKLGQPADD